MVERQVLRLYRKMKSRVIAAIKKDVAFEDFFRVVTAGKRTYSLHNSELKKSIDEVWVTEIEECIPHLEYIVNNPRKSIKQEENIVPVELAKKINAASVKHLASNSQYVNSFENGRVIPNKILNTYNEETLEIYENRMIATLVNRVSQFIDRRYYLLGAKGGDEFTSKLTLEGSFEHNDENTGYSLSLNVHQGAEYLGGRGVAAEIFRRLEVVRSYINGFKGSPFMKAMDGVAPVRPPIMKTNLIGKDPHYRACNKLWSFMDRYDKVGYRIDVSETDPELGAECVSEFDAMVMFGYLVLKNKLAELDPARADAEFALRRSVKPRFRHPKDNLQGLSDIVEREVLKYNLDGSNRREVDLQVKQAVSRALAAEKRRKQQTEALEKQQQQQFERSVTSAIKTALASEKQARRARAKEEAAEEKGLYFAIQEILNQEQKKKRQEERENPREKREREMEKAIWKAIHAEEARKGGGVAGAKELKRKDKREIAELARELEESGGLIARRSELAEELPAELEVPESRFVVGGEEEPKALPQDLQAEPIGEPAVEMPEEEPGGVGKETENGVKPEIAELVDEIELGESLIARRAELAETPRAEAGEETEADGVKPEIAELVDEIELSESLIARRAELAETPRAETGEEAEVDGLKPEIAELVDEIELGESLIARRAELAETEAGAQTGGNAGEPETKSEPRAKPKKRGFFARLFGRK